MLISASDAVSDAVLTTSMRMLNDFLALIDLPSAATPLLPVHTRLLSYFALHQYTQNLYPTALPPELLALVKEFYDIHHWEHVSWQQAMMIARLAQLIKPVEVLLELGGDDRLTMVNFHSTKLNKYYSSTLPRDDVIRRGSCTCSTMSIAGYEVARTSRNRCLQALADVARNGSIEEVIDRFDGLNQEFLGHLSQVLGLEHPSLQLSGLSKVQSPQIVCFPSGSDAEYLPVIVGILRSYSLATQQVTSDATQQIKVLNYVLAAGEVGSGTPNAANGQHFSSLSPQNIAKQRVGEYLSGIHPTWIELMQYKPRNRQGMVDFLEEEIMNHIHQQLLKHPASVAILHLVCGSKTGLIYPSMSMITTLKETYGERIIVVIDACQLRCTFDMLREYLAANCICLITGSKFFTGPPFAGAVLLPAAIANEVEVSLHDPHAASLIPKGVIDYITFAEVASGLKQFRNVLRQYSNESGNFWLNVGLHVRWQVSLSMMRKYHDLPTALIQEFTRLWIDHTTRVVQRKAPFLTVLHDEINGIDNQNLGGMNTIVSVMIKTMNANNEELRSLNADEYKEFHKLMTLAYHGQDEYMQAFAEIKVLLGQPVKLSDERHVLRIALGADMVVNGLQALLGSSTTHVSVEEMHVFLRNCFQSDDTYITNAGPHERYQILQAVRTAILRIKREDCLVIEKMAMLALRWSQLQGKDFVYTSTAVDVLQFTTPSLIGLPRALKVWEAGFYLPLVPYQRHLPSSALQLPQLSKTLATILPMFPTDVIVAYDLDAIVHNVHLLQHSFNSVFPGRQGDSLHCFAVKSCPIAFILSTFVQQGLGLECASIQEVYLAIAVGCPPSRIVFDSPCKTIEELAFAVEQRIHINCNSYQEVEIIDTLVKTRFPKATVPFALNDLRVGLRLNPLIGSGKISSLSTATTTSKFGVNLFDLSNFLRRKQEKADGEFTVADYLHQYSEEDVEVQRILMCFRQFPFLNGLMSHVGSQGMPLELMTEVRTTTTSLAISSILHQLL